MSRGGKLSSQSSKGRARRPLAWLVVPMVVLLQLVVPVVLGGVSPAKADTLIPAAATPGQVRLVVQSAVDRTHGNEPSTPIAAFKWLISAEHTAGAYGLDGSTNPAGAKTPGYDATGDPSFAAGKATCLPGGATYSTQACQWPSVRYTPGAVPVVAQGDQSDLTGGVPNGLTLAPGRYLVSVTADGYKIDGAHFDVDGAKGVVTATVAMHAFPVPLGTLRLRVFKDTAPVDGTYEVDIEKGLRGFTTHLNDVMGEVTTDFYGNRLCTNYVHDRRLVATDAGFTAPGALPLAGYSRTNYDPKSPITLDASNLPTIDTNDPGGACTSDQNGDVVVPNIGPDRYTASVIAPSGQKWYQTTTLEGNHDWDMWISENETGFDTEQTVGGEPVPPVDMGFVPYGTGAALPAVGTLPAQADTAPAAFAAGGKTVKGSVVIINTYVGGNGGVTVPNAGVAGANVRGPLPTPIITLSDLDSNDQMVYVGRGGADGTFSVPNVPTGNYQLTVWDLEQDYILDSFNVTVNPGDTTVDVGQKGLVGWYADIKGSVFIDTNGNGRRDPGEAGVPKFTIGVKYRDNTLLDAGQNGVSTNENGDYHVSEGYPISKWFILEAFNTRYKTTGITVQADNEPSPTTYLGAAVDVNVLPIIGLSGRVDWGVQPYAGAENGGIVGTVTYDTTRNELDPAAAVTEGYQPGIPGLTVHLYAPVACDPTVDATAAPGSSAVAGVPDGSVCNADDFYWHYDASNPDPALAGSVVPRLDSAGNPVDLYHDGSAAGYTTETWNQPKECVARQFDGTEVDQLAVPKAAGNAGQLCVEAPLDGFQAKPSDTTTGAFSQTVNGNYGFGTVDHDPATGVALPSPVAIPNGDYIVKVDIPTVAGKPLYQVTKEEDVNIFDGDIRAPQQNFPLPSNTASAGTDQSVGVGGPISQQPGIVSACAGALHTVAVTDKAFQLGGGSPFEGARRPLCDSKIISVRGGQAVAPNFNLFTPVPLPTHFWGLTINDLGLSQDKTQAGYGEAQPLPFVPMGIYDWSGKLVDTVNTDWNGMYEALEPSTSSYNCPLPAGPCPGMYYFKGNDPGQPGHVNTNYNPRFRTIGTEFQAWPGQWTVTDTAPTQVGVTAVAPGSTQINPVQCEVNAGVDTLAGAARAAALTPDLMSVSTPYMSSVTTTAGSSGPAQTLPITGLQISGAPATKTVTLTTSGTITPATAASYAYVQLPLLTTANSSFPNTPAGAVQRIAINANGTRVPPPGGGAQTASRYPIAALTASTIQFRLTGPAALTPNTTAAVATTVSATLPAWSVPGVSTPVTTAVTITGDGFGATAGSVTLTPLAAGTSNLRATVGAAAGSWTNNQIKVTVASNTAAAPTPGAYELSVRGSNGKEAVNGLTFHVLGAGYAPTLIQVNPPDAATANQSSHQSAAAGSPLLNLTAATGSTLGQPAVVVTGDPNTTPENVLQRAVDLAAGYPQALVVVWPGTPVQDNPRGEYYENLLVHSNVKIQGVGPGGSYIDAANGQHDVPGTRIDGLGFNPDNNAGAAWVTKMATIPHSGPANVPDSAVVTYLGRPTDFVPTGSTFNGALDGVTVTGGSQADFATTVNPTAGNAQTPVGAPNALITQGGGIYLHAAANGVRVSNDVIVGNSGSYGGGIRVGSPYTPGATNTGVTITRNRIRDNGGTNLAGGIGIFSGSTGYTVSANDLCGNFSAEYGGAMTHYGRSDNGTVSKNRVYLNQSYDEGGGVMIAGELNPDLTKPSTGAGSGITIDANQIQDNLANDDGGGLRFLSAGTGEIDVTNNLVVDNISTHEGGGIALDDSTNVHITGNTIMKNVTTATAVTSNGLPAPAGVSTATNSDQLQATLAATAARYSQPQDFRDNIIWGNLAGTWDPASGTVLHISPGAAAPNAPFVWDVGSVDTLASTIPIRTSILSKSDSTLAAGPGVQVNATGLASSTLDFPKVRAPYDVSVLIVTSRAFPAFRQAVIVANAVSPLVQGNYHLQASGSPASNAGGTITNAGAGANAVSAAVYGLLGHDVDLAPRDPGQLDVGADELP